MFEEIFYSSNQGCNIWNINGFVGFFFFENHNTYNSWRYFYPDMRTIIEMTDKINYDPENCIRDATILQ